MTQIRSRLAAEAWVSVRQPLDQQLSPLGLRAISSLAPSSGETIVDIGCCTGQTVLQLARDVGPNGRVVGVDISPVVLRVARERASHLQNVSYIEGDATMLELPRGSVDAFFSRFGVMAFASADAAFYNFHRILKNNGRIAFVCWRSLAENEIDFLPLSASGLEHLLDNTPFSFEKPEYIRHTLEGAGFRDVMITASDDVVSAGDMDATMSVLLSVGPLGKIIRENPGLRASAEPRVRAALAAKHHTSEITLRAATWIITAKA